MVSEHKYSCLSNYLNHLKAPRYLKNTVLFLTIILSKVVRDNVKLTELPTVKPSVTIDLSVSQANFCTKDITPISFIFN